MQCGNTSDAFQHVGESLSFTRLGKTYLITQNSFGRVRECLPAHFKFGVRNTPSPDAPWHSAGLCKKGEHQRGP